MEIASDEEIFDASPGSFIRTGNSLETTGERT
jgi:hypothetical protein